MRSKFRAALLEILENPVTEMHTTMWKAYKAHIRNIDPEDLPKKVRLKFARIHKIMEGCINRVVKQTIRIRTIRCEERHEETDPTKIRARVLKGDYTLTAMNGKLAAEFRRLLFEIYDELPKRSKKSLQIGLEQARKGEFSDNPPNLDADAKLFEE